MTVAVLCVVPRQQPIQGIDEVGIRPRSDLEDHQASRRMRHEDGQQAIAGVDVAQERDALASEIRQAAAGARPDRQLPAVYGKMLRKASRRRPRPPRAGADS